jgi:hypothetical protein
MPPDLAARAGDQKQHASPSRYELISSRFISQLADPRINGGAGMAACWRKTPGEAAFAALGSTRANAEGGTSQPRRELARRGKVRLPNLNR